MNSRVWVGMLVGSCLWLASASAMAQKPKVVVMNFTGKGGPEARVQVLRALRGKASFEKRRNAQKVLAARGLKTTSKKGRAAIAEKLGVDYIVWGRVKGRGASARTEIRFAGPDGKQVAAYEAGRPGNREGNETIQEAARAGLDDAMGAAAPEEAEETPEPEPDVPSPYEEKPKEPKKKKKRKRKDAGLAPIVAIMGGAGGRTRNITVNLDDGAGGTGTRKYESGVYFDIVLRLELRPLARNDKPALRGLLMEADGGFGIGLKAQTEGSTVKLDTKTWRVLGQLGYLYGIGKTEIGGLLGFGVDTFNIDDNGTLPSIQYLFLRLGPAWRYFIIERTFYVRLDFGLRVPFSFGELADTFGDAKGIGLDAALMLGGELDIGFVYAARVSLDYMKPKFSAFPGGVVPGLPGAAQGTDGTDRAINFHVMVGWAF